jgi:small subunit ribosomal protein S16
VGNKKNPIWRVVVADQRSPRDGRFIETIGHYNPQTHPSTIVVDAERYEHWVSRGAQPSGSVKNLMRALSRSAQPAEAAEPEAPDAGAEAPAEAEASA